MFKVKVREDEGEERRECVIKDNLGLNYRFTRGPLFDNIIIIFTNVLNPWQVWLKTYRGGSKWANTLHSKDKGPPPYFQGLEKTKVWLMSVKMGQIEFQFDTMQLWLCG